MADVMEINAETGKVITRDYNEAEAQQRAKDLIKYAKIAKAKIERETIRKALFDRLGITADEAAALLG